MAATGSYVRDRSYGASSSTNRSSNSDDYSSQRSNNHYAQNRNNSSDPDNATLDVVNELKRTVQEKIEQNQQINQPIIELEVGKIIRKTNPHRYDIHQLKRQLSNDVQNCPDSILRVSMAYGDDPSQLESVIRAKMNETNSHNDVTDTSVDNVKEPLQKLRRELADNPLKNLFLAVHNVGDSQADRADRLFFSEAHHFAPSLQNYTFDDAHTAVQAIRETSFESERPDDLIPILKTFRDVDEIREHLQKSSLKLSVQRNETKPTASRVNNDDQVSNAYHASNNHSPRHHHNENSSYNFKPFCDPHEQSSQISGRSTQGSSNRRKDDGNNGPSRRDFDRK